MEYAALVIVRARLTSSRLGTSSEELSRDAATWRGQFDTMLGRFGAPFHAACAVMACLCAAGPQAAIELGMLPLLVCWVLRLPFVWRGVGRVWVSPVNLAAVLLLVWMLCALLWTEKLAGGLRELAYWRWAWLPVALWPVMHLRLLLIGALAAGFVAAHVAQVLDAITLAMGEPWFRHPPIPEPLSRVSGWWYQPATGGTMVAAAVGLHVLPAVLGRSRARVVASVLLVCGLLGVMATGTRAAMLGSAVMLCGVGSLWVVLAVRGRGGLRRVLVGLAVVGVLGAVVAATPLGGQVQRRVAQGATELREAWRGNVQSDMGGRVVALRAAADAAAGHPVRGVGLDGFHHHLRGFVAREGLALDGWRVQQLATAHNTVAHIAASLGVVGVVLWGGMCGAIGIGLFRNAWLYAGLHTELHAGLHAGPRSTEGRLRLVGVRDALGSYHAAPLGAFVMLMVMSCFDTLHLNSAPACLVSMLAAFAVRGTTER
jgi:O-antigen ligase